MHRVCLSIVFSVALLSSVTIHAQGPSGSVRGSVRDRSGGALPGVVVTITGNMPAAPLVAVTDATGRFETAPVAPGMYAVRAALAGFRDFEASAVLVGAAPVVVDITLELAAVTEAVMVSANLDPFDMLPSRSSQTLFGVTAPLERIPRSISVVESGHITRYNVRTVNDLVTIAPGSFTGSYFGVPGSLFVRGEPGDNFFRGFRRVENRGNYATPVAASDHVEIVKGPPSPIYGGGKIGGFLNFVPKTALSASAVWMERPMGSASVTYGSYDQKLATVEAGVPFALGRRAGFYGFVQVEDSHSFYDGIYSRSRLGQVAVDVELSPAWRLAFGGQAYAAARPQNIGWNRVTQELVDRKQYLAGTPAVTLSSNGYDLAVADLADGRLQQPAFTRDMQRVFASDPAFAMHAALYRLDPSTVHLVTLGHHQIFADSPDFSDSFTLTAYLDVAHDVRPGVTVTNQTFFDRMNHQKFSTYGFGADYRPWVVENKTSLDFTFAAGPALVVKSTSGVAYRYSDVRAGESRGRGYQVIDRRDLSVGATPNDRFQGPFNSNGTIPFNYYQQGSYGDAGLFLLSSLAYRDRLEALLGVRFDRYTPDFTGRFNGEAMARARSHDVAATYHVSLGYALPGGFQPYVTYATSTYLELGQGSELDRGMVANGTYLQDSLLLEGGVKVRGLENRVLATAAAFRQQRTAANKETAGIDYFRTVGLEVEARAALHPTLSITGAYTWQRPEQLNIPFLLAIPPALLGFEPQDGYGGRFVGPASVFDVKAPVRVAGQPPQVMSLFGTYLLRRDTGVTLGATHVAGVNTGYVSSVRLPAYAVWRGSVFYRKATWGVNLAVNNLFNKEYYQSQYLFWDVFVKPSELRTLSLTFSRSF